MVCDANQDIKKVGIVIPTFNRAEYLEQAVKSALSQTIDCEVVVCDHGSIDRTPDVMKHYDDQVIYIRRDADFGPHFSWLDGVLNAKAEYIHIQFDDDWISEKFVEKSIRLMGNDVGMVIVSAIVVNQSDGKRSKNFPMMKKKMGTGVYDNRLLRKLLLDDRLIISPGACLFRKKDIIDALYQGQLPIIDRDMYHGVGPDLFMSLITVLRYKKFGWVEDDLAFFRAHEGSITVDANQNWKKANQIDEAYEAVRDYFRLLEEFQQNKEHFYKHDRNLVRLKKLLRRIYQMVKISMGSMGKA